MIADKASKLKQQQALYESVRAERNGYSKQLIESQAAIEEMKRQFKALNFHIQNLKDEITAKDHALVKEHFDHHKVVREKEGLANEVARVTKQVQAAEHILASQEAGVVKLNRIIREADEERLRQEKEVAAVVSERDVLAAQLVQRDAELAALYERLKVQKSTLARGAATYRAKVADLHDAQARLSKLLGELELSRAQVANLPELRREVTRLEEELLVERTKIRRLEDEIARPVHVHRWRQLEASDPDRFALIRKLAALQQRLSETQDAIDKKEAAIKEKEGTYTRLKDVLARQPGPEVAEQVAAFADALKRKQAQLASLDAELAAARAGSDESRAELKRLEERMRGVADGWVVHQRAARRSTALGASAGASAGGAGVTWASLGGGAAGAGAGAGADAHAALAEADALLAAALGDLGGGAPAAGEEEGKGGV
jgi:chromosome segregation ATPase